MANLKVIHYETNILNQLRNLSKRKNRFSSYEKFLRNNIPDSNVRIISHSEKHRLKIVLKIKSHGKIIASPKVTFLQFSMFVLMKKIDQVFFLVTNWIKKSHRWQISRENNLKSKSVKFPSN